MKDQPSAFSEPRVGEIGRPGGLLPVRKKMRLDGHVRPLRYRTERTGKLRVGTTLVGGLYRLNRAAQCGNVVRRLVHEVDPGAEREHHPAIFSAERRQRLNGLL